MRVHGNAAVSALHGLELAQPFRDRDLVAFLMAIPGEIVNHDGVPKGLLRASLKGTLPESIRLRRWKADFTALNNSAMLSEFGRVRELLGVDCASVRAGLVEPGILQQELTRTEQELQRTETATAGWHLQDVVGLELWLRTFFQ
jgi:asparagine synthase (glutamine-hydrolysing)